MECPGCGKNTAMKIYKREGMNEIVCPCGYRGEVAITIDEGDDFNG